MFGKFMNKKFFHPGSYPNVKMRWIHEQRDAAKKKSEEEKQATYQKEQESYQSRMLSAKSTEEKMKLDLNFLYDLPPGMKNDDKEEDEDKEKEVKFEWQKHAPRSKYINDLGLECADQPFGVCVRNIRCFKCRAWGHQNTDRECPLFFSNVNSEAEGNIEGKSNLRLSDPLLLVGVMKEQHGLTLKKSVIGKEIDPMAENQQLIASEEDDDDELGNADFKFVESLTNKQKRRLLKRLNKLEKNERKLTKKKKKEKKIERINYCSSGEDDVKSYKKQKISNSDDDVSKTEYDSKIIKEQKSKDNSKFSKKHTISASKYDSMKKCNGFDKKLKNSISRNDDKNIGYDNCYTKRKSSTSKHYKNSNEKGNDNYYKKGKSSNSKDNENSEDDKNYKQWKTCNNEDDTYLRREQQGGSNYKDRNYSNSHNENYREHGESSDESAKDEIDEKLHQIRNGIIKKGK